MKFQTSRIPLTVIVVYQLAGLPILVKYLPIFMSHSHDILEAYPLYIYSAGWLLIFSFMASQGRRHEVAELGLSSLPRTSGQGVHFPREKAWLYREMPISLSHPGRKGRGHVECLADRGGSVVILWLPRNLGAGIFINNLEKEPKLVTVRAKLLTFQVAAQWNHELLAVQDPSFRNLRYFSRGDIAGVLHSGELLRRITEMVDFISQVQGRLIIEDSLIAAWFPRELPQGNELFPRAYSLWHEVVAASWPKKRFSPFANWRSSVSLLATAAVIAAFVVVVALSLKG